MGDFTKNIKGRSQDFSSNGNKPSGLNKGLSKTTASSVEEKKEKRPTCSWDIVGLKTKNKDPRNWPFEVTKKESGKLVAKIHNYTELVDSFVGTQYNRNECPRVDTRYSLGVKKLEIYNSNENSDRIEKKIESVLFTFDGIYFLTRDGEFKGYTYREELFNIYNKDIENIVFGILQKVNYYNNNIKVLANNKDNIPGNEQLLRNNIKSYIETRKRMKIMKDNKKIIDLLDSFNVSCVKNIIFLTSPYKTLDYKKRVCEKLREWNINYNEIPEIVNEINTIPELQDEVNAFEEFVRNLERSKVNAPYRNIYLIKSNIDETTENMEKILYGIKTDDSEKFEKFLVYRSDSENKRKDELNKKEEEEKERVREEIIKSQKLVKYISKKIEDMCELVRYWNGIAEVAEKDFSIEYSIWASYLREEKIKEYLTEEVNYERKYLKKGINFFEEQYSFNEILNIFSKDGEESIDYYKLSYFESLLPSGIKDNRKTLKSMGIDLNTEEGIKKLEEILKVLLETVGYINEIIIGAGYATIAEFMRRFGANEKSLQLIECVLPDYIEKTRQEGLNYTENTLEIANRVFYLHLMPNKHLDEKYNETQRHEDIGAFDGFVMRYMTYLNGKKPTILVHTNVIEKIENLENLENQIKLCFNEIVRVYEIDLREYLNSDKLISKI